MSVENAPGLKLLYPYLDAITIPASTFHGASKDVVTVGTNRVLVASADLSDTEVYEAAKKIVHHIQDIVHDILPNTSRGTPAWICSGHTAPLPRRRSG